MHDYKMMILPSIFFSFFQNFDFPDCYVSKRAKNGHKLSKNYVCCAPYLQNHTSYIVRTPLPKMESPGGGGWGGGGLKWEGCPFFTTLQFSSVAVTFSNLQSFWVSCARFSSMFSPKSCTKTWYHLYISDPFW